MWSLGCIMAELYAGTGRPFLDGTSELEQIDKMCEYIGSPSVEKWPGLKSLEISKRLQFPDQALPLTLLNSILFVFSMSCFL